MEDAEEICMFKDSRVGTKAMRKNSAAHCVPSASHCNLRRFGNKDAGVEGQDSISEPRGSITVKRSDRVMECTRDVYL